MLEVCSLNILSHYKCHVLENKSDSMKEVTFGTKKKWSFKTGDLLKQVQSLRNFL
jgi:hypothetical protein